MSRRNGPVMKFVESVLGPFGCCNAPMVELQNARYKYADDNVDDDDDDDEGGGGSEELNKHHYRPL